MNVLSSQAIQNWANSLIAWQEADNKLRAEDFQVKLANWKANYFFFKSKGASVPPPAVPDMIILDHAKVVEYLTAVYETGVDTNTIIEFAGTRKPLEVDPAVFDMEKPAPTVGEDPISFEDRPGFFLAVPGSVDKFKEGDEVTVAGKGTFRFRVFPGFGGLPVVRWQKIK